MAAPIYRGFSTANFLFDQKNAFLTTDVDTVKQDLLNHIYTIPGERVNMPDFGTRIPTLAFEPLDETTLAIIREDLTMVMDYDPRVKLTGLSVNALPDQNAIIAFVDIQYLELDTSEVFKLEFNAGG